MMGHGWARPPLPRRDAYAQNIARPFDWVSKPRLTPPSLPTAPTVLSMQCSNQTPSPLAAVEASRSIPAERPKPHDMATLLTSGYLERLGFHHQPAPPEIPFRHPPKAPEEPGGN